VYERFGLFDTTYRIAADYDFMLRVLQGGIRIEHLPGVLVKMRVGGMSNKTLANILRKSTEPVRETVDENLLLDPAEQILAEQVAAVGRLVEPRFAARQYTEALQSLAVLRKAVDDFFDSVMVMADDPALRANRLALLRRLQSLFMHAADLSRLPG
jgi:glycyl-tRNA synthetase beta chain